MTAKKSEEKDLLSLKALEEKYRLYSDQRDKTITILTKLEGVLEFLIFEINKLKETNDEKTTADTK